MRTTNIVGEIASSFANLQVQKFGRRYFSVKSGSFCSFWTRPTADSLACLRLGLGGPIATSSSGMCVHIFLWVEPRGWGRNDTLFPRGSTISPTPSLLWAVMSDGESLRFRGFGAKGWGKRGRAVGLRDRFWMIIVFFQDFWAFSHLRPPDPHRPPLSWQPNPRAPRVTGRDGAIAGDEVLLETTGVAVLEAARKNRRHRFQPHPNFNPLHKFCRTNASSNNSLKRSSRPLRDRHLLVYGPGRSISLFDWFIQPRT